MSGSVRLASASSSLAFTALLLAGLIYLGGNLRKEVTARSISAFAIPLGAEEGQEEQQAQPDKAVPAKPAETQQPQVQPAAELPPPPLVVVPAVQASAPAASAPSVAPPSPQPAASRPAASAPAAFVAAPAPTVQPAPRKGARDGLDSNAPPGTSRSYAAKVRSWLYAHKTYPKRSRMRHEEGVVRVRFVLDRQGRLLEGAVIGGSGFAALDQEGQAMLSRASPYPAAPREISGERIEFTAPIEFVLPS